MKQDKVNKTKHNNEYTIYKIKKKNRNRDNLANNNKSLY